MLVQRLKAKNDINGNPRRIWVNYDDEGAFIDVIDEGYGGMPAKLRGLPQLPEMNITITEYNDWLKERTDL